MKRSPPRSPNERSRSPRGPLEILHGHRAVRAVLSRRPGAVTRVGCGVGLRGELGAFQGEVQELSDAELSRIAGTDLHEGFVVEVAPPRYLPLGELGELLLRTRGVAVALDRVRNPYNVGAILRSAAFFGVDALLLGAPAPHPGLAPDAVRVAEGGAEHVALARTTDLADSLARLRERGLQIVGTHVADAEPALGFGFAHPTVLVLGNEREGMSDRVRAACSACVKIEGSGAVESLNVAVAAGVLIAEAIRHRSADRPRRTQGR
ncbi:MAG: RNA methyltransferase [Myxococcales bacterium]|nr:RNA methyltransferase [Myxococcales bacterium]